MKTWIVLHGTRNWAITSSVRRVPIVGLLSIFILRRDVALIMIRTVDTFIRFALVCGWWGCGYLARATSGRWPTWSMTFELQSFSCAFLAGTWPENLPLGNEEMGKLRGGDLG